jgi:hypothetical protein
VSDEEIAQRVKDILDVARPDWTGAPLPYNVENPLPQVKAGSLLTCSPNNLDVYLLMVCQDVVPLGPVVGGMDIGNDDDDNLE